jgi:hypothetical protein
MESADVYRQEQEMQTQYRGEPNEHAISDKGHIAENGEDTQKAHVLGHER